VTSLQPLIESFTHPGAIILDPFAGILVVPKLDRLARSVPDARDIADALQARGVKMALGINMGFHAGNLDFSATSVGGVIT